MGGAEQLRLNCTQDGLSAAKICAGCKLKRDTLFPLEPESCISPQMRYLEIIHAIEAISKAGSVRKAAEALAITPTALNRKVLNLEEELGSQLFERVPQGLRLNSAGEIFLTAGKQQLALASTAKARVADLVGFRSGHVTIATSQSALSILLPEAIRHYRSAFPAVTFKVVEVNPDSAETMLKDYDADLALIYMAKIGSALTVLHQWEQQVIAVMDNNHPLAQKSTVELHECCAYPLALPDQSLGLRQLLDFEAQRVGLTLDHAVESGYLDFLLECVLGNELITFRISESVPIDLESRGWLARPLSGLLTEKKSSLSLAQLKGRTLSVAAAKFAESLCRP